MPYFTTSDGTQIYYTDQGTGQPVVFSHGWPLCSDAWQIELKLLADNGYRTIAHDRRGHGRSSQPWNGNEMDTYARDLAELVDHSTCATSSSSGTRPVVAKSSGTRRSMARAVSRRSSPPAQCRRSC